MSNASAPHASVEALRSLLKDRRRIAIVTHYNPDGDAMGSSLGLAHALKVEGVAVQVVLPNGPPGNLQWMPGYPETLNLDRDGDKALNAIRDCDLLFCLDFNRTDQVGKLEQAMLAVKPKVLIDHHQDPQAFTEVVFSNTQAPATSEMIHDILVALGQGDRIGTEAATCLYAGIVTDTGSFRFRSTSPHTMRVAAALMERNVLVDVVHTAIMDDNSLDRLRLLGFTLNERLEVMPELGAAYIALGQADLDRFHFNPGDTEGFVNYGLSIRGIRIAALFIERDGQVKISLRSKSTLPVNRFAQEHFDGGGHINAAGGRSSEGLKAAVAKFRKELPLCSSPCPWVVGTTVAFLQCSGPCPMPKR